MISDRNPAIGRATESVPSFHNPLGRHRYCLRHVASNMNTKFKDVYLKDLCYAAGQASEVDEFQRIMEMIKVGNEKAHEWLSKIPSDRWTTSYDGGWRHGMLTTNLSECINGTLKGGRRLPICTLVQLTYNRTVAYFIKRFERASEKKSGGKDWTPWAHKKYDDAFKASAHLRAQVINKTEYEARVYTRGYLGRANKFNVVSLARRTCSCGKWTMHGIPCAHVMVACRKMKCNPKELVDDYYSIDAWVNTYNNQFHAIPDEVYWGTPDFSLVHNPKRRESKTKGRDRTTRIPNEMDWAQKQARKKDYARHAGQGSSSQNPLL